MGKNSNKPVHKSQMSKGGGGGDYEEEAKAFHSKEFEQAQLESLLAPSQRPTWDEFKEQQRKKGELEGAEERLEEEAQRRFRAELDEARNQRLGAAEAAAEAGARKEKHKHKHKHKHKSEKHKSDKHKSDKHKHKRHRRDDGRSDDSSDSDSASEAEARKPSLLAVTMR